MTEFDRMRRMAQLMASASASALLIATPAFAQTSAPSSTDQSPEVQGSAPPSTTPPAATPPTATPDEAEPEVGYGTQDIVVTAQFRQERLQDTPISITAVNAAELEAKNQTNLAQVADAAPNVSLKPQGASFGPSISASIRGVGQNDFNPAYEPGVGIYIDDVYYPQLTGAVFDLLDLDRVEILRGPQGTLAGRNSEGGSIKLYSKKPTGENGGFVEASYGSRNLIALRAAADFKLTETLFGRVSGVFKQQEGFVDRIDYGCANPGSGVATDRSPGDCRVSKLGGVGYQAIRGMLRWQPTDALEVNLIGDYTHDEHTIAGEVLLATSTINSPNVNAAPGVPYDNRFVCGQYCNYLTTGQPGITFAAPPVVPGANGTVLAATRGTDKSLYDGYGFSGQVSYNLSDAIALTSITGYRSFDTKFDSDDDLSPANTNFGRNHLTNWSFSQELRANVSLADTLNFTVGGYYFKQKSVYDSYQDLRYVPVYPLQFRQPDPTKAEAKAAFAHLAWNPVENMTLSGGLRYTDENKEQTYYRLNYSGTPNGFLDPVGAAYGIGYSGADTRNLFGGGTVTALSGLTSKYRAKRVDYRTAVDYRFSPALLVYGSFSTGFKGGGSNPRPFNAQQVIAFAPESLNAYEVGFKSDLFDRRLRVNVSGFINDYKNIQIPVLQCPGAPCAARLNAGNGRIKGFEAEVSAFPLPGLSLDASLSYLAFKYDAKSLNPLATSTSAGGLNPGGVDPTDPPVNPPWKVSAGAQYKAQLGDMGSLTPRIDYTYQDRQFGGASFIGTTRVLNFIPSYSLVNARLTWTNLQGDLDVSLQAQNLFDKYYFLTVFDLRGAGGGVRKGRPGEPQSFSISLRKKF